MLWWDRGLGKVTSLDEMVFHRLCVMILRCRQKGFPCPTLFVQTHIRSPTNEHRILGSEH